MKCKYSYFLFPIFVGSIFALIVAGINYNRENEKS